MQALEARHQLPGNEGTDSPSLVELTVSSGEMQPRSAGASESPASPQGGREPCITGGSWGNVCRLYGRLARKSGLWVQVGPASHDRSVLSSRAWSSSLGQDVEAASEVLTPAFSPPLLSLW